MRLRLAAALFVSTLVAAAADPALRLSTYLGGNGRESSPRVVLALDGSMWLAITTGSPDLAAPPDSIQPSLAPGTCVAELSRRCSDVYVAHLSPNGDILRATYLGGSGDDSAADIQIDADGNVWVAGPTGSHDFPRANFLGDAEAARGSFIVKLSPDLKTVLRSTVLAGGDATTFTLDASGAVYLAGNTTSPDLPVANPIQASRTPGLSFSEGFIAKLTPSGDLEFATYFGGGYVRIVGLALDDTGRVIIAGNTEAADLPGGGTRYGALSGTGDAFVAKLAADGRSVVWLRYVGDSNYEIAGAFTPDSDGNFWLAGTTSSLSSPGFVTRIAADGATALFSRPLGYQAQAMAAAPAGAVWLTGTCCFQPFEASPTALQPARNGSETDAFLVQLGNDGTAVWSTYVGGTGADRGTAVALGSNVVVLAGVTQSFDFPLDHAVQKQLQQRPDATPVLEDGFLVRFGPPPSTAPTSQGIVNAAGFRSGEAAPGTIVSLFGEDLAMVIRAASSLPLPTNLGGTTVTVNGVAAPLFYVSPTQINLLIPSDTNPGTAVVEVRRGTSASVGRPVTIVPYSPGIFADNRNWAAVNTPSPSYVRPGEWLTLYATGLGKLDSPVAVTLGGVPVQVTWSGLAPGFVGLYQINVQLPSSLGSGYRMDPLVLQIGGKESNAPLVGVAGALPPN